MKRLIQNYDLLMCLYLVIYVAGLVFFIGLNHPFWTDESHFYRTITLFYNDLSIENLKHYKEMSTPGPFILYALWAKVGGLNIAWLRILSILIAFGTYFMFYQLSSIYFKKSVALILTIFLSLNPYMIGTSFFVYTDMVTVLSVILALYFHAQNKNIATLLCCVFAIWCRQYAVFFVAALSVYHFIQFMIDKNKNHLKNSFLIGGAVLTLIPLFILWGGLSPDSELKLQYLNQPLTYQFNGFTAYVISIAIYCFPLIAMAFYSNYKILNVKILIMLLICSFVYQIFPIAPSLCGVEAGFMNIGFADKMLNKVIKNQYIISAIYQILFAFGLVAIYLIINNIKQSKLIMLGMISIMFFLLLMPFSYLVWEKYLLPLLPLLILSFSFCAKEKLKI